MALEKPKDERLPGRRRSTVRWEGLLVLVGVLAFGVAIGLWRSGGMAFRDRLGLSGSKTEVDPTYALYAGDRACSECHPGEAALHSRSGHSRTLQSAAGFALTHKLDGLRTEDPERPGVVWKYLGDDNQLWTERTENGAAERFLIEYAFGSGRHATTFVTILDRDPLHPVCREHRLTIFAHNQSPGLTPGLSLSGKAVGNSETGRVNSSADTLNCFRCHTTVISDKSDDVLDELTMIPNVSCERCHGPARSHIEAARRRDAGSSLHMPFGPGRWTTNEQLTLCGRCHRLPAMMRAGAITIDNPALVRHQPVGMVQSACFQRSNRALNCVTCHDPHAGASPDRTSYERACLSCHGPTAVTACAVSPRSGCIDCHMPRRDVTRGMIMTDHWIRIIPESRPKPSPDDGRKTPTIQP
jgi:hypothetical protein